MFFTLPQSFKKILLLLFLVLLIFSIYLLLKTNLVFLLKLFLFLFLFLLFLSILTIFEMTNSFFENTIFWFLISLLVSYFYLFVGPFFFFLALLKNITQSGLLKQSLKPPFFQIVLKNYDFIILSLIIISNIYLYQFFIKTNVFPLDSQSYYFFLTQVNNFLSRFLNFKIPLQENPQILLKNFLEREGISSEIVNLLVPSQITLLDFLYQNLVNLWQNSQGRQILLIISLSIFSIIFYLFTKIFSNLICLPSLIFYYLLFKIGFIKTNTRSVNKEILEL